MICYKYFIVIIIEIVKSQEFHQKVLAWSHMHVEHIYNNQGTV